MDYATILVEKGGVFFYKCKRLTRLTQIPTEECSK